MKDSTQINEKLFGKEIKKKKVVLIHREDFLSLMVLHCSLSTCPNCKIFRKKKRIKKGQKQYLHLLVCVYCSLQSKIRIKKDMGWTVWMGINWFDEREREREWKTFTTYKPRLSLWLWYQWKMGVSHTHSHKEKQR